MPKLKPIADEMITASPEVESKTPKSTIKQKPKEKPKEKREDRRHENKGRPTYKSMGIEKKGSQISIYVPEAIKNDLKELVIAKGKKSTNELVNEFFEKEIKKLKKAKN